MEQTQRSLTHSVQHIESSIQLELNIEGYGVSQNAEDIIIDMNSDSLSLSLSRLQSNMKN